MILCGAISGDGVDVDGSDARGVGKYGAVANGTGVSSMCWWYECGSTLCTTWERRHNCNGAPCDYTVNSIVYLH